MHSILAVIQLAIYGAIACFSPHFDFYAKEVNRPLVTVVCLLSLNFVLHLWSLSLYLKLPDSTRLGWRIVLIGLLMRAILIGSTPIQEVDIYRYMWDGVVVTQAISPFRYPPLAIADEEQLAIESDVNTLRSVVASDVGIREVLHRVHYPELPTVYPPASQLVFAAAAIVTPGHSSVSTRLLIMKSWIVAFDLASLGCIWLLLRHFGKHTAWLIAWAWSPLVLKEFANSGHLDSIAVFFTLAATCLLLMRSTRISMCASGLMMGLAVASKLYPVVLLPLWIISYSRQSGWLRGTQLATVALLASFILLLPMFWNQPAAEPQSGNSDTSAASQGPLQGLSTFLTRWEMNDLLFMIIEENIRPAAHVPEQPALWFVVVPDHLRKAITTQLAIWSGQPEERIPFMATRVITAMFFLAAMCWLALRAWREPHQLPQWIFLALAWFWFLAPTQNPWYWCWALAFVPFAKSRLWLAVSGLSLIYYLRFWFLYHAQNQEVLGSSFRGTAFFDFVVVWLEFGPFLAVMLTLSVRRS